MALYQKYRPQTLSELVGQDFVRLTLQAALRKGQVAHAYLFYGSRGTGKTSTARILAKGLNCLSPLESGDPCNQCDFCRAADSGIFVDLIEIDGASNRRIEDARALIEKIYFTPTLGKRKVYIIDEVHMLTKEAFNALLKTIEEPPDHAYFLLATTELAKVPETIRSRCQVFTFQKFTPEQIVLRLREIAQKEGIIAEDEALMLIAKKAAGGLRDAIGILQQTAAGGDVVVSRVIGELGMSSGETLKEFYDYLEAKEASNALDLVLRLSGEGLSLIDFLEQFLGFMREKMIENALAGNTAALREILRKIDLFDEARRNLRDASIPTLPLEIAIVRSLLTEEKEPVVISEKSASTKIQEKKIVISPPQPLRPVVEQPTQPVPQAASADSEQEITTEKKTLSAESLQESRLDIMKAITDPVLKVGLRHATWTYKDDSNILLTFPSNSYREQSSEKKRFSLLLEAVRNIFSDEINITMDTVPVILEPVEAVSMKEPDADEPIVDPAEVRKILGIK